MQLKYPITAIFCFFIFAQFQVLATNAGRNSEELKFNINTSSKYCQLAEIYALLEFQSDSDRVVLKSGQEMVCDVKKVSDKFVFFTKAGANTPDWIERGEVHSIRYKNGEIVDLKSQVTITQEEKDWRSVKLTKFQKDVEGLVKVDDINVRFEAKDRKTYRSAIALERGAEIVIMKQAAAMNADIVYIHKINHIRAYGEPPVIKMDCEAYRKL